MASGLPGASGFPNKFFGISFVDNNAGPVPWSLMAFTLNTYSLPSINLVIFHESPSHFSFTTVHSSLLVSHFETT